MENHARNSLDGKNSNEQYGCMLEVQRADEQLSSKETQYEYLISACLCGVHCRYDGKEKTNSACRKLYEDGKAILVCPEVMGGLGTPREPSEFVNGHIVTRDGKDVTKQFESGARQSVSIARSFGITKAILKEASPSCGVHLVYDGTFSGNKIPGRGMTAQYLSQAGIEVLSDEEV